MLYVLEAWAANCHTRWEVLWVFAFFFFSLNSFVYYLRFIVPSSLQFICSRVRIINGSLNLFLITLPNAYTESLSCETQLGDAACDSWEWEEVSTQRMRMINWRPRKWEFSETPNKHLQDTWLFRHIWKLQKYY